MFPKNSFALVSYLIFNNILIFWQRKSQRFVFRCHFDENSVKILQNLAIWVIWIHICDCGRYESRRLVILPLVGVGERKRVKIESILFVSSNLTFSKNLWCLNFPPAITKQFQKRDLFWWNLFWDNAPPGVANSNIIKIRRMSSLKRQII